MTNAEIQVGEYVRTKSGNIGKVLDITNVTMQKRKKYLIKWNISKAYYITLNIINHDFNIIKLIEAGDYVNGYLVEAIDYYEDENGNLFDVLGVVFTDDDFAYSKELKNINIHSIVTKEQFKSMEYEVREDD